MKMFNALSQRLTEKDLQQIGQYDQIIELIDLDPELAEFIANPSDEIERNVSQLMSLFKNHDCDAILIPTSAGSKFKSMVSKNMGSRSISGKTTLLDDNNNALTAWFFSE